eukprot:1096907-Prorocentrum_minimum.AAC.1
MVHSGRLSSILLCLTVYGPRGGVRIYGTSSVILHGYRPWLRPKLERLKGALTTSQFVHLSCECERRYTVHLVFLLRGCNWSGDRVNSYSGAATGPGTGYIPIEGLQPVRKQGIFLLGGCDWSGDR